MVVIPEIVDYELRRELIRLRKSSSISRLDAFLQRTNIEYLPVTTAALRLAANQCAKLRQQGIPTADPHALDVDVILVAQVLSHGFKSSEIIVATSNPAHISRLVPADLWSNIR